MLATAARPALVTALLMLLAPGADAQGVHPRCTKSNDKVKCTCFRQNGGHIIARPGGGRRAVIHSDSQAEGYYRCMVRNGRPNG
jgi:hypothetical protein